MHTKLRELQAALHLPFAVVGGVYRWASSRAPHCQEGVQMIRILTIRPDFTNTEYMNTLADEWGSHAFTTAPLSTEAVPQAITAKNIGPVQPSGPVASRAGSVLGA
jgi:hypothetical protein